MAHSLCNSPHFSTQTPYLVSGGEMCAAQLEINDSKQFTLRAQIEVYCKRRDLGMWYLSTVYKVLLSHNKLIHQFMHAY